MLEDQGSLPREGYGIALELMEPPARDRVPRGRGKCEEPLPVVVCVVSVSGKWEEGFMETNVFELNDDHLGSRS